ncbi:MAG TPA: GNAT family N-acetyltransferase [Anaerolineales bacterium]|nr:GNAT family N-acetyltransferase [Anaerolineales bacterium]
MTTTLKTRFASVEDCSMLAAWNYQLIRDEGHHNPMNVWELEERMRGWLASGEYLAVIFEENEPVAYALFRETEDEIYLRQFFVVRHKRREGIGSCAMAQLFALWPKEKRWTVSVLVKNIPAVAFWQAQGYADYSLTLEILPGANLPQRSLQ